jgi:4-amino-4-deoxy-L-arabinose transferase-like glycosyltransferase
MTASTRTAIASARRKRYLAAGVLLLLCALIAAARAHTFHEPLERDITTYAVIAHEMLQGRGLYSDLWDLKPPAVFVTYAAAELLTSYGPDSIYLLGVSAAVFTLWSVYWAGAAHAGARCGLWAAAFWALVCSDLYLQANQPNTEVFINALLAAGFALIVALRTDTFHWRRVVCGGVLFALASLFKQVTLAVFVALAVTHVLAVPGDSYARKMHRHTAVIQTLVMLGFIVAAWACVTGYFYFTNRGQVFYQTLVVIGRLYAGNPLQNLANGFNPKNALPPILFFSLPLLAALIVGMALDITRHRSTRHWMLLLGYLIGTQMAVALPGKFQPHYYQFWLPPLVIGAGWAMNSLARLTEKNSSLSSIAPGALLCAFLLSHELPFFRLSPDDWSRRKYGEFFIKERALASEINLLLNEAETFYEYGREAGFYFYTTKRPPTGVIAGPTYNLFSAREIADLQRVQPELVVVCTEYSLDGPVIRWLIPRYEELPQNHERAKFILLARRGGALEKRLRAKRER